MASETDSRGIETRYYYNSKTGYLLASTGPDGNGVAYTYDGMGRMTLVRPASVSSEASSGYVYYTNAEAVSYIYNSTGALGTIMTDTTTYNFTYDAFGNSSSVSVGNMQLANYTHNANNGKLSTMTYGNGVSVKYDYDELDRTVKIWYKGSGASSYIVAYEYKYDASGNLCTFYDRISDQVTTYKYDSVGRLCEYYVTAEYADFQAKILTTYDNNGRVQDQGYSYEYVHNGTAYMFTAITGMSYRYDGAVASVFVNVGEDEFYTAYDYDILGRQTQSRTTLYPTHGGSSVSAHYQYTYSTGANGGTTSLQMASVKTTVGSSTENYSYTYDNCGRITHIRVNGTLKYSYEYDDLGQLVRENNTTRNKTYIYTYDTGGNITSKKEYPYTTAATASGNATTYVYDYGNATWGDLLTSYRGQTITYDDVGNPLSYYNGYSYTFTWTQGRRLATAVRGSNTLSFEYNDEGIRTSKTVNGITHYYQLAGSRILSENWTDASGIYHVVIFVYDENGSPIGMSYSNSTYSYGNADNYLFVKNMQGDIVHICDEEGNKIVSYQYDAWGTVTSYSGSNTNAYKINPFRYRGYYYDVETGLYYLNSRYYDPEMGRFINADEYVSTGQGIVGNNMFVYCNNNPINGCDPCGTCLHRWDFWNDCDACGGKTLRKKLQKAGEWINNNLRTASGAYALYDQDRFEDQTPMFGEGISVSTVFPSSDHYGISLQADFLKGGWRDDSYCFSLFDIGHAEVFAGIDENGFGLSALASIWSPSVSFKVGKLDIEIGAEVGAIGAGMKKDATGFSISGANGIGGTLRFKWN